MIDFNDIETSVARHLPVFLLLDISGSMAGNKIESLNKAVAEMISQFSKEEKMEIAIMVTIITFGNKASLHLEPTKASEIMWNDMQAGSSTPMGAALKIAKAMVEDKNIITKRDYRPTVILISDGQPTDEWKGPLNDFINEGRSSKCDRMAIAIGSDADENVLNSFIQGTKNSLMYAENASRLHELFNFITMSVTIRSRSQNPNIVPPVTEVQLDGKTIKHKIVIDIRKDSEGNRNEEITPDGQPAESEKVNKKKYW